MKKRTLTMALLASIGFSSVSFGCNNENEVEETPLEKVNFLPFQHDSGFANLNHPNRAHEKLYFKLRDSILNFNDENVNKFDKRDIFHKQETFTNAMTSLMNEYGYVVIKKDSFAGNLYKLRNRLSFFVEKDIKGIPEIEIQRFLKKEIQNFFNKDVQEKSLFHFIKKDNGFFGDVSMALFNTEFPTYFHEAILQDLCGHFNFFLPVIKDNKLSQDLPSNVSEKEKPSLCQKEIIDSLKNLKSEYTYVDFEDVCSGNTESQEGLRIIASAKQVYEDSLYDDGIFLNFINENPNNEVLLTFNEDIFIVNGDTVYLNLDDFPYYLKYVTFLDTQGKIKEIGNYFFGTINEKLFAQTLRIRFTGFTEVEKIGPSFLEGQFRLKEVDFSGLISLKEVSKVDLFKNINPSVVNFDGAPDIIYEQLPIEGSLLGKRVRDDGDRYYEDQEDEPGSSIPPLKKQKLNAKTAQEFLEVANQKLKLIHYFLDQAKERYSDFYKKGFYVEAAKNIVELERLCNEFTHLKSVMNEIKKLKLRLSNQYKKSGMKQPMD